MCYKCLPSAHVCQAQGWAQLVWTTGPWMCLRHMLSLKMSQSTEVQQFIPKNHSLKKISQWVSAMCYKAGTCSPSPESIDIRPENAHPNWQKCYKTRVKLSCRKKASVVVEWGVMVSSKQWVCWHKQRPEKKGLVSHKDSGLYLSSNGKPLKGFKLGDGIIRFAFLKRSL